MSNTFPLGAKVRFTQGRLSVLTARDRKGLAGRIGVVQTAPELAKKPTVHFPAEGALPELRLVELPSEPEVAPSTDAETTQTPPEGGGSLSQSELDKLFD